MSQFGKERTFAEAIDYAIAGRTGKDYPGSTRKHTFRNLLSYSPIQGGIIANLSTVEYKQKGKQKAAKNHRDVYDQSFAIVEGFD